MFIPLHSTNVCYIIKNKIYLVLGWLRFHYDNEYENDNETSLSFSLRFCTQIDEPLIDTE